MAKRKADDLVKIEETGAVVDADGASLGGEVDPASEAGGLDEGPFVLGTWNELTLWQCRYCPWNTLAGEGQAMAHYIGRHL